MRIAVGVTRLTVSIVQGNVPVHMQAHRLSFKDQVRYGLCRRGEPTPYSRGWTLIASYRGGYFVAPNVGLTYT
jgi:hypothetical protein